MALRPKLGLVLSGGGTRGLAHIGALEVFHQHRIRFDAIAGCSMGAIIGAAYAAGRTPEEMKRFVLTQKLFKLVQWPISTLGLTNTTKFEAAVAAFLGVRRFEDLHIPMIINATNVTTRRPVVFTRGPLMPAIRASISIPGILAPVKTRAGYLVDGGVLNQSPFSLLPPEVQRFVLVNCSPPETISPRQKIHALNLMRSAISIMENEITQLKLSALNPSRYVLIEPPLAGRFLIETEKAYRRVIAAGRRSATSAIADVRRLARSSAQINT